MGSLMAALFVVGTRKRSAGQDRAPATGARPLDSSVTLPASQMPLMMSRIAPAQATNGVTVVVSTNPIAKSTPAHFGRRSDRQTATAVAMAPAKRDHQDSVEIPDDGSPD